MEGRVPQHVETGETGNENNESRDRCDSPPSAQGAGWCTFPRSRQNGNLSYSFFCHVLQGYFGSQISCHKCYGSGLASDLSTAMRPSDVTRNTQACREDGFRNHSSLETKRRVSVTIRDYCGYSHVVCRALPLSALHSRATREATKLWRAQRLKHTFQSDADQTPSR